MNDKKELLGKVGLYGFYGMLVVMALNILSAIFIPKILTVLEIVFAIYMLIYVVSTIIAGSYVLELCSREIDQQILESVRAEKETRKDI